MSSGYPEVEPAPATARRHRRASMMGNVGRREFVQGVGPVVGALAATAGYPPALAQLTTNVGSKPMTYEIKPLSFDPKNIKGLSEKLLLSHYENNYSVR